jgi:hypothetical protein
MRNGNGSVSDNRDDMDDNNSLTDRDIEALLAGRVPSDPALNALHGVLASMKTGLVVDPDPHRASVFSTQLAAVASATAHDGAAVAVRAREASPWRRRLAAVAGVAAIAALGVAGAAAANESVPGDLLYGIDQALESVGILDGGTPERLGEAQDLLDMGDVDGALELTIEALESDGDGEAAAALQRAAVAVASESFGDDVRARVATMLEWMAGEESRGEEFGATVSEFARQLSGVGNADAGNSGNAPASPGDSGKAPAEPGNSGNAPASPGDSDKAPAEPGNNGKAPVAPANNGKAPVNPSDKDDKDKDKP